MRIRLVHIKDGEYVFPATANLVKDQPFHGWLTVAIADESAPNKQRVWWFNSYHIAAIQMEDDNGRSSTDRTQ